MRCSVNTLFFLFSCVLGLTAAFDKYADALAKYKKWQERYGSARTERQTKRRINNYLLQGPIDTQNSRGRANRINEYVIPVEEYAPELVPETGNSIQTNFQFSRGDQDADSVVRETRNVLPFLPYVQSQRSGSEYIHSSGVPLYKIRKRWPHGYGRKKRSADPQGWTLLDPKTGRPLDSDLRVPDLLRTARKPLVEGNQISDVQNAARHYLDTDGNYAPAYKYYKRYPYTG